MGERFRGREKLVKLIARAKSRVGKNLIQKLKLGLVSLGLISSSYFNAPAQNNNYKPKYQTIAHKMLMIEDSADNIPLNTYPNLKNLDSLIDNSKKYIEKKENYTKQEISKIADKIYLEAIDIMPGIKKRNDICSRTSLIYLAIGQANGIPFYLSLLPSTTKDGHVFIRYDPDGKHDPLNPDNPVNKGDINIETTEGLTEITNKLIEKEKYFSDEFFMKRYYLKREFLKNNNYLRNLNEKELLSHAYAKKKSEDLIEKNNNKKLTNKDYDAAIQDYNKAIALDPKSYDAFTSRGMMFKLKGEYKKAIKDFEQALKIHKHPSAYRELASFYSNLKQYEKAIQEYTNAINLIEEWKKISLCQVESLDVDKSSYLFNRSYYYKKIGNKEKANQDYEALKKIYLGYAKNNPEMPTTNIDSVITDLFRIEE